MKTKSPTSHPDVNKILNLLFSNAQEILVNQFVGMYLYGSLSSGDFNPETSDIDFLVVTTNMLSEKTVSELEAMHNRIWAGGLKWASKLEGAYVDKELIRRHDPNGALCPIINEAKYYIGGLGSDWIIQRYIVREYGVVLAGPDPKALIDPVSSNDIRGAVMGILREWWFPMIDDPSWLQKHESNYHGYTVITMCRALHALQHGTVVSKPVAIKWAQDKLGVQWHKLIEQAIASQYGKHSDFLDETLDFIRFTSEQTSQYKRT